jgi:hypothetical protein
MACIDKGSLLLNKGLLLHGCHLQCLSARRSTSNHGMYCPCRSGGINAGNLAHFWSIFARIWAPTEPPRAKLVQKTLESVVMCMVCGFLVFLYTIVSMSHTEGFLLWCSLQVQSFPKCDNFLNTTIFARRFYLPLRHHPSTHESSVKFTFCTKIKTYMSCCRIHFAIVRKEERGKKSEWE